MKKIIALLTAAILAATCTTGCGKLSKPKLDSWQVELLEAEGLPTEYSELTAEQKHFIDRVGEMINYLNQKYDAEFVYYDYEPPELLNSEKLYAYPKSTGIGNGKYLVTVKARNGGFEDDFHDFSVAKLAEDMVNEFLLTQFKENEFKLFHRTNSCEIRMSEIDNGNFKWKYGGSIVLFLKESACNMDNIEKFAVSYAKFLYEHQLSGNNRINILKTIPDSSNVSWGNAHEWYYDKQNYIGFYGFHFDSMKKNIFTNSTNFYNHFDTDQKYSIEEYFSKFN